MALMATIVYSVRCSVTKILRGVLISP